MVLGSRHSPAVYGDPGIADRATELADFAEHVTVWAHAGIKAEAFLDRFDLNPGERQQITQLRRLFAAFWVMRLRPGGSAYRRNPPEPLNARRAACSACSGAPDERRASCPLRARPFGPAMTGPDETVTATHRMADLPGPRPGDQKRHA